MQSETKMSRGPILPDSLSRLGTGSALTSGLPRMPVVPGALALATSLFFTAQACANDYAVVNNNSAGPGSLISAIATINATPGAHRIIFDQPLIGGQTILNDALEMQRSLEFVDSATPVLILDTQASWVLNVSNPSVLDIRIGRGVGLEGNGFGLLLNSQPGGLITIDGTLKTTGSAGFAALGSNTEAVNIVVNGSVTAGAVNTYAIQGMVSHRVV